MNELTLIGKLVIEPYEVGLFKLHDDVSVVLSSDFSTKITVKSGFLTDMGSVPQFLRNLFPYVGNQYLASCYLIHDALYATQGSCHDLSKEFVDELLYFMIRVFPTEISDWKAWCIFKAVSWFGKSAWNNFDKNDKEAIQKKQLQTSGPISEAERFFY